MLQNNKTEKMFYDVSRKWDYFNELLVFFYKMRSFIWIPNLEKYTVFSALLVPKILQPPAIF